ncbi:hypothetical protein SCOCK_20040 [Actinacidiphila cocklensis]|uniref:Uncharacterized protein n=1 Tax=Actinacidiphila cocklensis TaxID=887465 RepID=A0A9W4DMR6_9ACTN|nr:hypothetical protein SCOCK_20040 [Actinacidiphila cocklensis]
MDNDVATVAAPLKEVRQRDIRTAAGQLEIDSQLYSWLHKRYR